MKEKYKCMVCGKFITDDEGTTTLNGLWVCDNDHCRTLDDDNEATERIHKNTTKRITTIRKNQQCYYCEKELLKGSKVIVVTYPIGRTMKRLYYCTNCNEVGR